MTLYAPGQYYFRLAQAAQKQMKIYDQAKIDLENRPNIFFYMPRIFAIADQNFDFDHLGDNLGRIFNESQKRTHLTADQLTAIAYHPIPYKLDSHYVHLSVTIRLFDENAHLILERVLPDIHFNHPEPNKAYAYAYLPDGRQRFNGVGFFMSDLGSAHTYTLELFEDWSINMNLMYRDFDQWRQFSRRITIPIKPKEGINRYQPRFLDLSNDYDQYVNDPNNYPDIMMKIARSGKDDMTKLFRSAIFTEFQMSRPDHYLGVKKFDPDSTDLSQIGRQSILLEEEFAPRLICNFDLGVYEAFTGNYQMVQRALTDAYAQHDPQALSSLSNLIEDTLKDNRDQLDAVAAIFGVHFDPRDLKAAKYYPELTHVFDYHDQGSSIVARDHLVDANRPRYQIIFPRLTPHRSHYDFENLTEPYYVPFKQ